MSKKPKVDDTSDSDELQALFDSLAAQPPAAAPAPAPTPAPLAAVAAAPVPPPANAGDGAGDSDELQDLFDSVSAEADTLGATAAVDAVAETAARSDGASEAVFNRLGTMTRKLHDTLRELGLNGPLNEMAEAMPDARQRLDYIAKMTEQAACKVLNATDIAQPIQHQIADSADALHARWDRLFAGELSPDEFRALSTETHGFLAQVSDSSRATSAQLMEIVMAQDFQDLTGQVIKRVVELARTLETQLLQTLIEAAPTEVADRHSGLMNGPVVDAAGREDVVTDQEQVDDLLESLGF